MSSSFEEGPALPELKAVVEEDKGNSVLDLLKQDHDEIAASSEVFIRVVGYDKSGLQVKYRLPESGELATIGKKIERQHKDMFARNLYIAMDTMIALCEGIYVQPEGVEEPVGLDFEESGEPCGFDERLAVHLGMDGETSITARDVVRRVFDNRDFAIISHAEKLNRWLVDAKADVDKEFWEVGE
jgi:hypothetical protein